MLGLLSRRSFFAGALATLPASRFLKAISPSGGPRDPRLQAAYDLRSRAALAQSLRPMPSMRSNGDEAALPNQIACFTKGLPQNRYGEVEPAAYQALLTAMKSGKFADFEKIPRGGGRRLSNPQSSFAFHLEGGDPHSFGIPPAPSIRSQEATTELNELYWQALCRDIPFSDYKVSPIVGQAAKHLGTTTANIFRGERPGNLAGPYISQFLFKPVPYGAGWIEQRYNVPIKGSDFMTSLSEWSQIQTGFQPWRALEYETTRRYIRNGRDLAEYVHYDFAYQAYLNAALILVNASAKSVLNCNQFKGSSNPYRYSTVEEGFVTFGPPEAADWLGRVSTAALKAAYCQKWMVHRRLRPEALGGLIHQTRVGLRPYPIHASLTQSEAVDAVFKETGTYLLPQAYPEGCPLHPSYPAGHAAIAGACSVILKACYDGDMLLPAAVEANADGTALIPCPNYFPTVNDEIDKLAFNVAMGRNWAGIHYRSDNDAGLRLGEDVGISVLQDLACTYTEDFKGFSFKRIDGKRIHITANGEAVEDRA